MKSYKYILKLDINIVLPPMERSEILELPIEKELGINGKILLSVPKYKRDEYGNFVYEPVSLNIAVNDLIEGIQQIKRVLRNKSLLSESNLKFNTEYYNLLDTTY